MSKREIIEKFKKIKKGEREACIFGAGIIGRNWGFELIKKRGIKPNYYCDSDSSLWGKEIKEGIKCISLEELIKRNPICFLMVSAQLKEVVYKLVKGLGITDIILYDELCEMELDSYFDFMNKKQTVVYTCIVNGYDEVREPLFISEDCDYYLISDNKPEKNSIYKYIDITDIDMEGVHDFTRKNRYCKVKAHEIFPDYRYSIYIDGNLTIKNNMIYDSIKKLPKTRIITHSNNFLSNIYMEAMKTIGAFRDNKDIITKQMKKYWLEGMPDDFGSFLCGILIREHNNPVCVKLMNDWWEEIKKHSKKDQLSFPYILWKNGYTWSDVGVLINKAETTVSNENPYVSVEINHKLPRGDW